MLLHAYVLMRSHFHLPRETPAANHSRAAQWLKPRGIRGEQPALRRLGRGVGWERMVRSVESIKGEEWESFRDRHGDWERELALWLGRRQGRLTLAELAGGLDYTAAGAAVSR